MNSSQLTSLVRSLPTRIKSTQPSWFNSGLAFLYCDAGSSESLEKLNLLFRKMYIKTCWSYVGGIAVFKVQCQRDVTRALSFLVENIYVKVEVDLPSSCRKFRGKFPLNPKFLTNNPPLEVNEYMNDEISARYVYAFPLVIYKSNVLALLNKADRRVANATYQVANEVISKTYYWHHVYPILLDLPDIRFRNDQDLFGVEFPYQR